MQSRCRVSQNWSHILTEKAISMVAALSASAQEAYVGLTIRHSTSYSNTWQLLNPVTDGDHSGGFSYARPTKIPRRHTPSFSFLNRSLPFNHV
ncbi:hypothetical protein ACFX2H_021457 [Malus domestica]